MPGQFQGKVAVITGGSRGIGRAIAAAFAREGAQTVIASSSEANLAAASKVIAQAGAAPLTVAGDLRTLAGCQQVLAHVQERLKRCDILVNSAGATRAGNYFDLPDDAWLDGYALKFFGCVRMCRLFWPLLKDAQGHVVNIIGGAARSPGPDFLIGGSVQCRHGKFLEGTIATRQEGRRQRQRHPSRRDRRPSGSSSCWKCGRRPPARRSSSCAPRPPPRTDCAVSASRRTSLR